MKQLFIILTLAWLFAGGLKAGDEPGLGPATGEPSHTVGLFDLGFMSYINYEMIADQSWVGVGLADGLIATGFLMGPWTYPVRIATGWQGVLQNAGMTVMLGYPIYGVMNGYQTGDDAKKMRGWAGCAVNLMLSMHSHFAGSVRATDRAFEFGFIPAAGNLGGMAVGNWKF